MRSTSASSATAAFEIKSADLPVLAFCLNTTNLERLDQALKTQLADTPGFFDNDAVILDASQLPEDEQNQSIDFIQLNALLRSHQLTPVAFKAQSEHHIQAALAAGLAEARDERIRQAPVRTVVQEVIKEVIREVQVPMETKNPGANPTMVVDKPLRSGQKVYARGADLIVMAMVNPGAEVIADGNIHVYAPLRGKAMAGARGNSNARIYTLCLEPELISVAGIYRTSDVPLPENVEGKPALIRLDGEKLLIEPLKA